jgi:hypothetical protein
MVEIPKDKPLVSHLARKTFACTIGLANGMNIGVLSKILGHASIQVTLDSYATVIDSLMLQNVRDLKKNYPLPRKNLIPQNAMGKAIRRKNKFVKRQSKRKLVYYALPQ